MSTASDVAIVLAGLALSCAASAEAPGPPPEPAPAGWRRWFDPSNAPFIPVPEIDADPNSGTTLGLIPTWLSTDDAGQVRRIVAPDIIHNPNFGYGVRGRIFEYPSTDTQWFLVVGAKQHVEKEFDFEWQKGRLRETPWSFAASVVYDKSGTARFYGIGNASRRAEQSNFTFQQKYLQGTVSFNFTHTLQLSYHVRARAVDVDPGSLPNIPSTNQLFPDLAGLGTGHETLHRLELSADTRDDETVPTRGGRYVAYAGVAAEHGVLNASLYRVVGLDLRQLFSFSERDILAAHAAWRVMPGERVVPFWALSMLGGDQSILGENQLLRAYGAGRFYDRDSFSASVEYRRRVADFDAFGTHIAVQVTPFLDEGAVSSRGFVSPRQHLHSVVGMGFRGIASPFIVGYVDVGYGHEGAAVFTGLNYPF